ncbi:ketopantoate reductase family protein [Mycolicibacterium smegmatis]|uniref:ketopantoate reductase family protein n=1 Tax=Mycolicibacterium smegmatis TaxID=1772 RepID=UPI00130368A9|nr:2-dehydropantoate 2-reductase N-terminal domain-containing protein [Mycolicibacterium smegmatis]
MTDTTPRPVVVYGTGAIGGVIAAQLRLGGFGVTAVARGDHLRAIRADGLKLVTQAGEHTVSLPAAANAGEVDWSTQPVVILAVKSHQTAAALDDLAAHAPADTAVLAAQNGVANEMAILRRFANVYGVTVMLPAAHLEPGVVVQQSHPLAGILDLGRYPCGTDAVADDVAAMLRASQFLSEVREDIMAWKHRKLIMNLGNGVTAVFRPGPAADELAARARAEAEDVLAAAGIPVVPADQDGRRRGSFLAGRVRDDVHGSTWQSVARGHTEVETDYFNGEIALQARLIGRSAPVNEYLQGVTADHARHARPPRSLDAAEALSHLAARSDAPVACSAPSTTDRRRRV